MVAVGRLLFGLSGESVTALITYSKNVDYASLI